MKQWVVVDKENGFDSLNFKEGPVPKCGDNEVLVKLRAASLNYRDLIIPKVRH
jgi:NADPH:quinone reductase-like Zn-dependent oxidoreductase